MFIIHEIVIFGLSYLVYTVFPLLALNDYFLVTSGVTSNIYLLITVLTLICAIFLTVVALMVRYCRTLFIFLLSIFALFFVEGIFLKADGEISNYTLLCVMFALIIAPFLSVLLLHIIKKSDIERKIKRAIATKAIRDGKYKFWYQAIVAVLMAVAATLLIGCIDSAFLYHQFAPYKHSEDDGHVVYQVYFFICWVPVVIGYALTIILVRKLIKTRAIWVIIAVWVLSSLAIYSAFAFTNFYSYYNLNSFLIPYIFIAEAGIWVFPALAVFCALGALFAHIHMILLKSAEKEEIRIAEKTSAEEVLRKSARDTRARRIFIVVMALVAIGYTLFCFSFASRVNEKDFEIKGNTLTKYNGRTVLLKIPANIGGNAVTAIGDRAFAVEEMDESEGYYYPPDYHEPTTMIIVSEGITTIGENAFAGTDIFTVKLPSSVKNIGAGAFAASNIYKIELPKNITEIADRAFLNCVNLRAITLGENITHIGKKSFQGSGLVSITIPEGVKVISEDAFWDCPNLQSVDLPKSVIKIEAKAFADCPNLRKINLHAQDTDIHPSAFVGSTNVTFSQPKSANSVTTKEFNIINGSIVKYTGTAENLIIPREIDGVKIVAMAANLFENNHRLITVDIQADLDHVGNKAFKDCVNLREVTLPDSVLNIEGWSFSGCKALKKINIPKNITVINSGVFSNCEELEYLVLPEKLEKIGVNAFYNCANLDLKLPKSTKVIDESGFYCCRNITTDIPPNIVSIGHYAFAGCYNLPDNVTIGKNAQYIGEEAFRNCGVRQVTFLNSTVKIDDDAFNVHWDNDLLPVFICKKGSTADKFHKAAKRPAKKYYN